MAFDISIGADSAGATGFDIGVGTTTWLNVVNTFARSTSSKYEAAQCAVGGPYAASEVKQEVAIPDGYQYGTAVLTFARANVLADDTGTVTLEVLNAANTVLASVTTGAEVFSTLSVWERRRLAVALPDGAATLRTRLIATRTLGTGDSGAAFDDFDLRVFKDLDPVFEIAGRFDAPARQPAPASWQDFHVLWPSLSGPAVVIAQNVLAISSHRTYSEQTIAWSDGLTHDAATFPGLWADADGAEPAALDAFRFVRAAAGSAVDLQVSGGTTERGAFTSSTSFTVRVVFRTDELAFASACGLVGRRAASGLGWGLQLDATGHVVALLQGASGTKTATSAGTVHDGAPHCAVLVYDAAAKTLRVYVDRRGYVQTSTAAGLGEFAVASAALRIGRDHVGSETLPGQLLEVELIPYAYTQAEVESMWAVGADPSGLLTTTISHAAWTAIEPDASGNTQLVRVATDQCPIGYAAALTADGGTGYGIALASASTNLMPTNNTADASKWVPEATVAVTTGVADVTGLPRGITVTGDATHGLTITGITGGAAGTVSAAVFLRCATPATVRISLLDATGVEKAFADVAATATWTRFDVALTWDNATATFQLRFRSAAAVDIAHVAFVALGSVAVAPVLIQDAGTTLGNVSHDVAGTLPLRFNHEGEIDVVGACLAAVRDGQSIAIAGGTPSNRNLRQLLVGTTQHAKFRHLDGATVPGEVADGGLAFDWKQRWRLRGRWARASIPNGSGNSYAGLLVDASVDSESQNARTAAWTVSADVPTVLQLGGVIGDATASLDGLIRSFRYCAREAKTVIAGLLEAE